MDISEKYIKMCKAAPDIQEKKPDGEDDRTYFFCTKHNQILCCNSELEYQWCGGWANWHDADEKYVIWLPRQDQLYELHTPCTSKGYSAYGLGRMFGIWLYANRDYTHKQGFNSIEQHLLAFVMRDKYLKRWNGSEWGAEKC